MVFIFWYNLYLVKEKVRYNDLELRVYQLDFQGFNMLVSSIGYFISEYICG